jgi:hypothetical protein
MRSGFFLALLASLLLNAASFVQTGATAEQAPANSGASTRIVAIGDVHGSIDGLLAILKAAQLIDDKNGWIGGGATLVQTGDYTDRGDGVREVLELLMRLERDASRAGGRVHVLLGNHEAMNLLHEFRDVSSRHFASFADARSEDRRRRAFKEYVQVMDKRGAPPVSEEEWMAAHPAGFVEYTEALAPGGRYGRWLRARKVVINEGGTIFMHAGLPPELEGSLNDVNRTAERELDRWDRGKHALVRAGLIRTFFTLQETQQAAVAELERIARTIKERRPAEDYVTRDFVELLQAVAGIGTTSLLDAKGPLWFRGFAQWPDEDEPKVIALLQRFDAARTVTAHTPMLPGRITPRFNNRVFLIDTGMLASHYKGGRPSALEFAGARVSAIYTTGREVLAESAASLLHPADLRGSVEIDP